MNEIEIGLGSEDDVYKENILDHYKNPHNKKEIKKANIIHKEINPTCGDEITIYLKIKKDKIEEASYQGNGCAISQASISMLTDKIKGMTIDAVKKLKNEDIYKMLGIRISIPRIRCAILSLKAVQNGLKETKTK